MTKILSEIEALRNKYAAQCERMDATITKHNAGIEEQEDIESTEDEMNTYLEFVVELTKIIEQNK